MVHPLRSGSALPDLDRNPRTSPTQPCTVRFGTASEMLDFFHLFKDGKRYRRIMQGFQRVFAATTFFGTNEESEGRLVLDWARFHFFDKCAAAHLSNYVVFEIM